MAVLTGMPRFLFVSFLNFPIAEGVEEEEADAHQQHGDYCLQFDTYMIVIWLFMWSVMSFYQLLHLLYFRQRHTYLLVLNS
jgi:hypothetical protein